MVKSLKSSLCDNYRILQKMPVKYYNKRSQVAVRTQNLVRKKHGMERLRACP